MKDSPWARCVRRCGRDAAESENDAKLAQKLGQLQAFIAESAVLSQECMGQLASFGPT
jgi:hypothetical protein